MTTKRWTVVLSLVERGWQAARECSLDLQPRGICVVHLLKGRLSRSVRALIEPKPHVRIISMPRKLFWPVMWLVCCGLILTGRLRSFLVDNERSYRRLSWWARVARLNLTMVQQGVEGYELRVGSQHLSRSTWRELLEHPCASL